MDDIDCLESLDASGALVELVKSRKWVAVIDICERRKKKGDTRDAIKILRAIALNFDHKSSKKASGLYELETLLQQNKPVTDPDSLSLLERLRQSTHHDGCLSPSLDHIWERAASSLTGNNVWIFKAWFEVSLRNGLYNGAKQATMSWMKAYPKDHDPFFLFIVINELISRLADTPDAERRLCQMLAYKALATAASDTSGAKPDPSKKTGRVLASVDDICILVKIYRRQGKYREALDLLQDYRIGIKSPIANHSFELAQELIELQGLCGEWESQWLSCHDILRSARPGLLKQEDQDLGLNFGERGDDWSIWNTLIFAISKLAPGESDFMPRTEQLAIDFSNPKSRNASLAMLKLHSEYVPDPESKKLFKKCQKYFEEYSSKIACMRDLRPYVAGLSRHHQEMLVTNVTRRANEQRSTLPATKAKSLNNIILQVNALKLDYNIIISQIKGDRQARLLSHLTHTCLRLFDASILLDLRLSQSDQGPADDAAILAAMASVRLYHLGQKDAIFKSVAILEYLFKYSKHNYEALLIVVQLYMYLGLGSLALDRFARLSIKNIQQASMTWIIFTRISKLHPWPLEIHPESQSRSVFDPLEELRKALAWHNRSGTLLNKALDRAISRKQYLTVVSLLETQELLQHGSSRQILEIELRSARRLRGHLNEESSAFSTFPYVVDDNRDKETYPNYEPINQATSLELLPTVLPTLQSSKANWLLQEICLERIDGRLIGDQKDAPVLGQIDCLLNKPLLYDDGGVTPLESRIRSVLKTLEETVRLSVAELLSFERLHERLGYLEQQLKLLAVDINSSMPQLGPGFGDMKFGHTQYVPLWFAFHGMFTTVSLLYMMSKPLVLLLKKVSESADWRKGVQQRIDELEKICDQMRNDVHSRAVKQREEFQSSSFQQFLSGEICSSSGDIAGEAIRNTVGAQMIDSFCAMVAESYADAYDGVLKSSAALLDQKR